MKKLIYVVFIITGIVACEMIELPESKISKEPIFNSENGLKLYTNSFYEVFPYMPTLHTNSYYIAENTVIKYFTENGYSAEESSGWNWGTLRNINYFIENNEYDKFLIFYNKALALLSKEEAENFKDSFERRIQIRRATPVDSMNEGGVLRAVDQQFSVHSQR